jgi:hypothetical protein
MTNLVWYKHAITGVLYAPSPFAPDGYFSIEIRDYYYPNWITEKTKWIKDLKDDAQRINDENINKGK